MQRERVLVPLPPEARSLEIEGRTMRGVLSTMGHLFRLRRSRLVLLIVGVVLFGFWRIVQRRKVDIEDMVTDREGPYRKEDWSNIWHTPEKQVKHDSDFEHPLYRHISRATQRWEDVI